MSDQLTKNSSNSAGGKYIPPHKRREMASTQVTPSVRPDIFTSHALTRQQQRHISIADIDTVSQNGKKLAQKESTTYINETTIVVKGNDGPIITVTENKRNTRFDLLQASSSREQILITEINYYNNDYAMCELAELYLSGALGNKEVQKAYNLLIRAANKSNSHAMCLLAKLHESEDLGFFDLKASLAWLERAASLNNKYALAILGQHYLSQYLQVKEISPIAEEEKIKLCRKANVFLERAANRGSTRAMWQIANIYEEGLLGEKNLFKAIEIYTKAAKEGSPSSIDSLNKLVLAGKMRAEAFEVILEEVSQLLARTSADLAIDIGMQQVEGLLGKNPKRGLAMIMQVAQRKSNPDAMLLLAKCYKKGLGCEPDLSLSCYWSEQSKELYEKAASLGNVQAMCDLGDYYFLNRGDINKAIIQYEKVVVLFPKQSLVDHNLACCYHIRGQQGDINLAIQCFERVIKLNPTSEALCEYGCLLYQQANKGGLINNKALLEQVIIQLKQAIIFAKDDSMLSYSNLEKVVIEEYLQQLVAEHNEISVNSLYLAYYLLINTYLDLGDCTAAKQTLEVFEKHLICALSLANDEGSKLKIEFLLLTRAKQIVATKLVFTDGCCLSVADASAKACNSTSQTTSVIFSVFNNREQYIIEHRHENLEIQREYDKRFGLIISAST